MSISLKCVAAARSPLIANCVNAIQEQKLIASAIIALLNYLDAVKRRGGIVVMNSCSGQEIP